MRLSFSHTYYYKKLNNIYIHAKKIAVGSKNSPAIFTNIADFVRQLQGCYTDDGDEPMYFFDMVSGFKHKIC